MTQSYIYEETIHIH